MTAQFYWIIYAIIAVNGCDDDTLLEAERMIGDRTERLQYLLDGSHNSYWYADNNGGENVYLYYPSEVEVKWIFVQRYHNYATHFSVYDRSRTIAHQYFGDSSENYDSVTIRFNDLYTDYLRFYFWYSSTVYISRLEVHGCYNTSTPTTSPTTGEPTHVPTLFPTVSPTLAPLTTIPTELPTALPTTAPTVSPTITEPSLYPSTVPSRSPTELPSIETFIPSTSPTLSPTTMISTNQPSVAPSSSPTLEPTAAFLSAFPSIFPTISPTEPPTVLYAAAEGFQITVGAIELLWIVVVCLCAVLVFVFLRYRKAMLVSESLRIEGDNGKQSEYQCYDAEDYMMRIRETGNKRGVKVVQTGNKRGVKVVQTGNKRGVKVVQTGNKRGVKVVQTGNKRGVKVVQTGNRSYEVEERVVQNNKTLNTVGEDIRQKSKDHHLDIRFALDNFSSDNGEVFNSEENLEIGPQDSDL